MAEPEPVHGRRRAVDPVLAMYRAIDGAGDLSQVLDALVDGVGSLFPRAALFVVKTKSKRLQGWRSVGFTGVAAITREFEFPLTTDSALTRAVTASRTIFTGDGQSAAQSAEAWTVTFPVTTGGRVVAVVHADGGARQDETGGAFDRETALDLGHTLVRMAGERIGALTMSARAAFGNVMSVGAGRHDAGQRARRRPRQRRARQRHARQRFTRRGRRSTWSRRRLRPSTTRTPRASSPRSSFRKSIATARRPPTAAPADASLQERLAGQIEGARTQAAAPAEPAAGLGARTLRRRAQQDAGKQRAGPGARGDSVGLTRVNVAKG